jgi:hypothetical protein
MPKAAVDVDGTYTTLDVPGAIVETSPRAINNLGQIVSFCPFAFYLLPFAFSFRPGYGFPITPPLAANPVLCHLAPKRLNSTVQRKGSRKEN